MGIAKRVLTSLLLLVGISCILSYFFYDGHTVRSFLKWNLLFIAIQLCIHQGITYLVDLLVLKRVRQQELELAIASANTTANLPCPCERKYIQPVNINLNADNTYKCIRCEKSISAKIDISTFLKTEAIAVEKLPEILKSMENNIQGSIQ